MAFNFPSSPAVNDTYSFQGKTWRWNGLGWALVVTDIDKSQAAFDQANTGTNLAQSAYYQANTGTGLAQSAFDRANTKFNTSGGTIAGNVEVTGNLSVSGTLTSVNTQTLQVGSNTFVLNADLPQTSPPTTDASMIINRGSSANVYIGWDEGSD